ncbi:MAG: hypothetical protein IPJ77_05215 [Planctomycetes bacterium]|nr:hypothetical protein [Planctomycetota bacterium]
MKPFALLIVPAVLAAGGLSLHSRYEKDRAVRVEVEMSMSMDTETKMERDGEPVEGRGMGGMSSDSEYKEVHVDHVVEAEDGKPSKVKRHFEELGGTRTMSFGEEERSNDVETPIAGLTILLSGDDAEPTVEVVDGKKPEDEKAFEKERIGLFLDGVLPTKDVEEGATWDLSKEQVLSILRLDAHRGLFPPPQREGGEGGEGGGRRGGGRMGGFGGGDLSLLFGADWKGKAKLTDAEEEVGGVKCAVIELELTASGELPMPEMRAGGRRERMLSPESAPFGNSYEVTLEGKLAFDLAAKRPASLTVEGKLSNTMDMEREGREGGTMKIHTERNGKFKLSVKVSEEKVESK